MSITTKAVSDFVELFHGSRAGKVSKIDDGGVFGGIFSSPSKASAESHGKNITRFLVPKDKILTQSALDYDINYEKVADFLKNEFPEASEEELDTLHKTIVEDKGLYNNGLDLNEDSEKVERILGLLGESSVGEADWAAQRARGKLARRLGYNAVEMADEHGTSYLIMPGVNPAVEQAGTPTAGSAMASLGLLDMPKESQVSTIGRGILDIQQPGLLNSWQGSNSPHWVHSLGRKLYDIELPGQIKPLQGTGEYLMNFGYDDPLGVRAKRALNAGLDFL